MAVGGVARCPGHVGAQASAAGELGQARARLCAHPRKDVSVWRREVRPGRISVRLRREHSDVQAAAKQESPDNHAPRLHLYKFFERKKRKGERCGISRCSRLTSQPPEQGWGGRAHAAVCALGRWAPAPTHPPFPPVRRGDCAFLPQRPGQGRRAPNFHHSLLDFLGRCPAGGQAAAPTPGPRRPQRTEGDAKPRALPRARPALREGVGHHLPPGRPPHTHTQLRKGLAVAAAAVLSTGRFRLTFY